MRLKLLLISLFFISITVFGVWKYNQSNELEVDIIQAKIGSIESVIRVTGNIINDRTVSMTALINGQIQAMRAKKGEQVKAGQVIAVLDQREADALLDKAKAVVLREKQSVNETRKKYKRLQKISRAGNASDQSVEDVKGQWNAARARLQVAIAELRVAEIYREKVEIKAPWDGVIIDKFAEQGQWIEAGIKLFSLVALKGREIEANVNADDSGAVKIGQTVSVSSDAFPNKNWQEKIHWISPAINTENETALNSFAVRMTLGSSAPALLLGQQVDIKIRIDRKDSILKLPYSTLFDVKGKSFVAIAKNKKVKYVPVKTGIDNFTHVEIIDGITTDDLVITYHGKVPEEDRLVNIKSNPE